MGHLGLRSGARILAPLLVTLAALHVAGVAACDKADMSLANRTAKIVNVEASNATVKHSVGGQVTILDGCTFRVRNMTLIPSGNGVYWYGVRQDKGADMDPRVVAAALGSYNGQLVDFTLDPQYSFSDFAVLAMMSEGDGRAYGAFSLGGNIPDYFQVNTAAEGPSAGGMSFSLSAAQSCFASDGAMLVVVFALFIHVMLF